MKTALRFAIAALVLAGTLSGAATPAKTAAKTTIQAPAIGGGEPIPLCPPDNPYCY